MNEPHSRSADAAPPDPPEIPWHGCPELIIFREGGRYLDPKGSWTARLLKAIGLGPRPKKRN